jgi:hypothetical protein
MCPFAPQLFVCSPIRELAVKLTTLEMGYALKKLPNTELLQRRK